jgi:hypothetical protein
MSRSLLVAAMAALAGVAAAGGAHGQTARAAVLADTIRVGDVVPVAVRVTVGPGERVGLPLLLPLGGPTWRTLPACRRGWRPWTMGPARSPASTR